MMLPVPMLLWLLLLLNGSGCCCLRELLQLQMWQVLLSKRLRVLCECGCKSGCGCG